MTTAFVLSGGGSLGAVQVGMLQVLAERDVLPDPLSLHDHTPTVTPPTDEHECTAAPEPDRAAGHPAAA